jgi:hypothetical protein
MHTRCRWNPTDPQRAFVSPSHSTSPRDRRLRWSPSAVHRGPTPPALEFLFQHDPRTSGWMPVAITTSSGDLSAAADSTDSNLQALGPPAFRRCGRFGRSCELGWCVTCTGRADSASDESNPHHALRVDGTCCGARRDASVTTLRQLSSHRHMTAPTSCSFHSGSELITRLCGHPSLAPATDQLNAGAASRAASLQAARVYVVTRPMVQFFNR